MKRKRDGEKERKKELTDQKIGRKMQSRGDDKQPLFPILFGLLERKERQKKQRRFRSRFSWASGEICGLCLSPRGEREKEKLL